jgi:hypothetical protein
MPRLALEGVVGADAIFSCIGPALEVFSRYAKVEKANGEGVSLREYLEHVWAAVSREALSMIFSSADTSGLEPDARVTAMWLWTLAAKATPSSEAPDAVEDGADTDDVEDGDVDEEGASSQAVSAFEMDFDAARKIAQGLGARLEELESLIQIRGDKAQLRSVAQRTKYLFGRAESVAPAKKTKATTKKQMTLFAELGEIAESQGWDEVGSPKAATTTLDRVHQGMLLFGSGRSEALKRFLVEDGVGQQSYFWKLAQALSALYPGGTDEKRWIDGVLARKKGLGF